MDEASYQASLRQTIRSQAPRLENGNWLCGQCRNVNYARREFCNRCQMPRPADPYLFAYVPQTQPPLHAQMQPQLPLYPQPNTHLLEQTHRIQLANNSVPKPVLPPVQIPQSHYDHSYTNGYSAVSSRRDPFLESTDDYPQPPSDISEVPSPMRPFPNGFVGNQPGAPISVGNIYVHPGQRNTNYPLQNYSQSARSLWTNSLTDPDSLISSFDSLAISAQRQDQSALQKTGPKAGVDGNWMCVDVTCRNVNYPRRKYCNRCGRQRTHEQDELADSYFRKIATARPIPPRTGGLIEIGSSNIPAAPSVNPYQSARSLQSIWNETDGDVGYTPEEISNGYNQLAPRAPMQPAGQVTGFTSFFGQAQPSDVQKQWNVPKATSEAEPTYYPVHSGHPQYIQSLVPSNARGAILAPHASSVMQSPIKTSGSNGFVNHQPTNLHSANTSLPFVSYPQSPEVNRYPTGIIPRPDGNWICSDCNSMNSSMLSACNLCGSARYA